MTKNVRDGAPHAFWRLKRLRESKGVTLDELAERTGLTKSYLSKVERGISVPSVATALKVAEAFEVNVGDLFGVNAPEKEYVVVRKSERKTFVRTGQKNSNKLEAISAGLAHGLFEAFVTHPPHKRPPDDTRVRHKGHELVFVVKGQVEMSFPHASVKLDPGDCMLFNGQLPHHTLSVGKRIAEALIVVVNEPA